jgi:hypothetical protein
MDLHITVLVALAMFGTGCASSLPVSQPSFPSTGSSYSASPSFSAPSAPAVPHREQVTAGLVVRPDLACIPFALRTTAETSEKAVASLKDKIGEIAQRVGATAGGGMRVRMRGFALALAGTKKASGGEEELAATADGAFDLPLAEGLDYWARSRLVAAVQAAIAKEVAACAGGPVRASFEAPQLQVHDPEAFRGKLMEQWVKRARAFADAAQNPATTLQITDCTAPGEIAQRAISSEEVALSLAISCRIDTGKGK